MRFTPLPPCYHTPTDSLVYLYYQLGLLLDISQELILGVHTDHPVDENRLPEHQADALDLLEHAKNLLTYETQLHGGPCLHYSTGVETTKEKLQSRVEKNADGIDEIVQVPLTYHPYIDGREQHPLSRKENKPRV